MFCTAKGSTDLQYTCGAPAEQTLKDMSWLTSALSALVLHCRSLYACIVPSLLLLLCELHVHPLPQRFLLHATVNMCRHSEAQ